MEDNFTPQPGDTSINIPVTFDYRGGRSANIKHKITVAILTLVVLIIGLIIIWKNESFVLWQQVILSLVLSYICLFVLRFFGFNELYFSDMYESMKERNCILNVSNIWGIFDIDVSYPYICYFKNGYKGVFVKMERDTITGKSDDSDYIHYNLIGDAYNLAHSKNMNIVHIDYMDNVGNDPRLYNCYNDLNKVNNPDMQEMLLDIYDNLQDEMQLNYSSFDIYLFLTRDRLETFLYNVQSVVSVMLGGNFLTYKILSRNELGGVCTALFNLEEFSVIEACENVYEGSHHSGIIPISITHENGVEEKLNKTQEEIKLEFEEKKQQLQDAKAESKRRKNNKKFKIAEDTVDISNGNDNIDLFGDMSDSDDNSLVNDSDDFNVL